MATDSVPAIDRIAKALQDLEAQKTLITNCTLLWKNLSDHFSSLQQTLADRSKTLDSDLETLESDAKKALESLAEREASLPDRESAAAAVVEERRSAVLAEIESSEAKAPEDLAGILRWYARRMDSGGLWKFMVSRRRDLAALRREISESVAGAVDPARLVLDAVKDYLDQHEASGDGGGGPDRSWALGMLLRALFEADGRKAPEMSGRMRERAAAVAEAWKEKFGVKGEGEGGGGGMGGPEAHIFLQMVVAFGLSSRFEEEFLRKLVLEHASRKELAKLVPGLGFGEKLADIIDELSKTGKEIDAVYFAHESGLTERFPPVPLLKSYLQSSRKKANTILKTGNHSIAATEESANMEIGALRYIIKCVENCNLESKFSIDGLKKRLTQMEKAKAERKRNTAAKSQNKRTRAPGGAPVSFRAAKATRTSGAPYATFHRNLVTPPQIPPARHSYNYPGQGGFDGPASAAYGAAHNQSPTPVPHQYFVPEDMGGRRGSVPYVGPSVNYGGYDYAAPHNAGAQPSYPH